MCTSPNVHCPAAVDRGECMGHGTCCINERLSSNPFCICYEGYIGTRCETKHNTDDYDYDSEPEDNNVSAAMSYSFTGIVICLLAISLLLARVSRNRFSTASRRLQNTLRHRQTLQAIYSVPSPCEPSTASSYSEFTASVDFTAALPIEIDTRPTLAYPSTFVPPVHALITRLSMGVAYHSRPSRTSDMKATGDVQRDGLERVSPTVLDDVPVPPPPMTSTFVKVLDVRY